MCIGFFHPAPPPGSRQEETRRSSFTVSLNTAVPLDVAVRFTLPTTHWVLHDNMNNVRGPLTVDLPGPLLGPPAQAPCSGPLLGPPSGPQAPAGDSGRQWGTAGDSGPRAGACTTGFQRASLRDGPQPAPPPWQLAAHSPSLPAPVNACAVRTPTRTHIQAARRELSCTEGTLRRSRGCGTEPLLLQAGPGTEMKTEEVEMEGGCSELLGTWHLQSWADKRGVGLCADIRIQCSSLCSAKVLSCLRQRSVLGLSVTRAYLPAAISPTLAQSSGDGPP
ncbi:unnamed protein product [Lota lota]